ncbi:MAG: putative lipid II flippase FtsW [Clostridia bacterium]|nr:putative lipid II flippase FtsW [Clostridia bacterium]
MESNITPIKFRSETENRKRRRQTAGGFLSMDFPLFFTVIAISLFGLVMLFSASYYKGMSEHQDGYFFVKNQAVYLAAGIAAMFGISFIPYKIYRNRFVLIAAYLIMIGLLLMARFMGKSVLGAQRWIVIGRFSFQPSEIVKFILIVCIAAYMSRYAKHMHKFFYGIVVVLLIIMLPAFLIYIQPNMSMLIIVCIVTFLMMFMGGASWKQLLLMGIVAGAAIVVLIFAAGYRSNRVTAWQHPWDDPLNGSYQIVQSLYAFGNGGLLGQGLDASRQKLLFLPEMENDYILAIIAEELGFVGVVCLLLAYAFVIYRGIRIALSVKDRFAALVAGGISCTLAVQVLVNVAVVTNSIPATGQTLPFISAGGSSLLVFLGAIGVLLNISRYATRKRAPLFPKKLRPAENTAEPAAQQ